MEGKNGDINLNAFLLGPERLRILLQKFLFYDTENINLTNHLVLTVPVKYTKVLGMIIQHITICLN